MIIYNIQVYTKESNHGNLSDFYYLVLQESYLQEENNQKLSLTIQLLWKIFITFQNDYLEKIITIFSPINSASQIARLTVKVRTKTSNTKKKCSQPAQAYNTNKYTKQTQIFYIYLIFDTILIVNKKNHALVM